MQIVKSSALLPGMSHPGVLQPGFHPALQPALQPGLQPGLQPASQPALFDARRLATAVPEDIVFCIDTDIEAARDLKPSSSAAAATAAPASEGALLLFTHSKLAMNPSHRFALAALKGNTSAAAGAPALSTTQGAASAASSSRQPQFSWVVEHFTNDMNSLLAGVQSLHATARLIVAVHCAWFSSTAAPRASPVHLPTAPLALPSLLLPTVSTGMTVPTISTARRKFLMG
ncbi:unnamed protein product [Closterium sp. Yama58-4]|nr:unnamed protein product [Closterium sp. Yama58-4]